MYRSLLLVALSLSLLLSTLVMAQDASYTFTTLDVPGALHTQAWGINAQGHIVGLYVDNNLTQDNHGFLYDGTSFTTLDVPFPNTTLTRAYGINDHDQIVGFYQDHNFINHGFLYVNGVFTALDVPFPGTTSTAAFDINAHGQIVGQYVVGGYQHGFLYDGTSFTPLDVPDALQTVPFGINDDGQIVGFYQDRNSRSHGFLHADGIFTTLDVPFPGTIFTGAFGINADGQIVGGYNDSNDIAHGFLHADGIFTTLDVPFPDALFTAAALDINQAGQIVGYYQDRSDRGHGFVATPSEMVDTTPPVITASASPSTLRPPNGQLVPVTISGKITDGLDGSGVSSAAYQVTDEYGQIQPNGTISLAADGSYTFTVRLEASRRGNDQDGRRYTIVVSATDDAGNPGRASTTVIVPRN